MAVVEWTPDSPKFVPRADLFLPSQNDVPVGSELVMGLTGLPGNRGEVRTPTFGVQFNIRVPFLLQTLSDTAERSPENSRTFSGEPPNASIGADPRVLPHYECPLATVAVSRMVGLPLREFRSTVNEKLPGIDGCTHMNDTLRSLAEVPVLVTHLV